MRVFLRNTYPGKHETVMVDLVMVDLVTVDLVTEISAMYPTYNFLY